MSNQFFQAFISSLRVMADALEQELQKQPVTDSPRAEIDAPPPDAPPTRVQSTPKDAPQEQMSIEDLSAELRKLETETKGRLFPSLTPLLIQYMGAIPGPGGAQMPAGGVQQLPPEQYVSFLSDATRLAQQIMGAGGTQ